MTTTARLVGGVLLALFAAGPVSAQSFSGKGSEATRSFALAAGTVTFEVEHHGEGTFTVRLLDAGGTVVDQVANGTGTFGGSKVVRIARTGEYHLDVQAPGDWKIELKASDVADETNPSTVEGRADGRAEAGEPGTLGWLGRGFAGGLIAGPMGLGFMVSRVDDAAQRDAQAAAAGLPNDDLAYAAAYRQAYRDRLRQRRQRSTIIGGVVGTGVFVYALTRIIHLNHTDNTDYIPDGGGTPFLVVPIRF